MIGIKQIPSAQFDLEVRSWQKPRILNGKNHGGKIYIGTNDDGTVVGVKDSKKLPEDIPKKVRDILGILVDVNLLTENGKDYIEICISPNTYPVNYRGEYHYRSGSTRQLLDNLNLIHDGLLTRAVVLLFSPFEIVYPLKTIL